LQTKRYSRRYFNSASKYGIINGYEKPNFGRGGEVSGTKTAFPGLSAMSPGSPGTSGSDSSGSGSNSGAGGVGLEGQTLRELLSETCETAFADLVCTQTKYYLPHLIFLTF